jgi:hypothetical protein
MMLFHAAVPGTLLSNVTAFQLFVTGGLLLAVFGHDPQELFYVVRDPLRDRFERFFSAPFLTPPREAANGRSPCRFPETHERLLEFTELLHFSLGLLDRRRSGQCLRDGPTIDLIGEPEIGAVAQLTGLMAVTLWFIAATRSGGDVAGAKVAELCNPPEQSPRVAVLNQEEIGAIY